MPVSDTPSNPAPFNPALWQTVKGFTDLTDITYHRHVLDGVAQPTVRVAFNRPEVRNAFRPHTVDETELLAIVDHGRPGHGCCGVGPARSHDAAEEGEKCEPDGRPEAHLRPQDLVQG